jgi:ribosomal protein S12 methylthiotransferase
MQEKSVHFVSLGCSKNLVDSQVMLGTLNQHGYTVNQDPTESEVLIVNTCAFVEEAKKESIKTILDFGGGKKDGQILVVSGCLSQRYSTELEAEMPEIDLIVGTGEYNKIHQFLEGYKENKLGQKSFVELPKYIHTEMDPRMNTSPGYMAWLKVSEGCDRKCTFCIIPKLRGSLRSRSVESLVTEANNLVAQGVKEINVISQDLSSYGVDLDRDKNNLLSLLQALDNVEGLKWVRLFYYYPDELTDEVIAFMAQAKKICSYLDMPVQHFSDPVLKRMNRKITGEKIHERIERLRELIPKIVIRTSVIVGFPGETEEQFQTLLEGVKKAKFDHLGVFKYSDEEGTPAFKLEPKNDQDTIDRRFQEIYQAQEIIAETRNTDLVGKELEVLVEGAHDETDLLYKGRFYGQAPDIDGCVVINDTKDQPLKKGDFVKVRVTDRFSFDLVAELV